MKNDEIINAGKTLFHQLATREPLERRRAVGTSLAAVGLGLTITTNLREMVVVTYDQHASDRDQFVSEWRRLVMHEKGKWYAFRLGVRPVQMGLN